jgi:hypothetical protein
VAFFYFFSDTRLGHSGCTPPAANISSGNFRTVVNLPPHGRT